MIMARVLPCLLFPPLLFGKGSAYGDLQPSRRFKSSSAWKHTGHGNSTLTTELLPADQAASVRADGAEFLCASTWRLLTVRFLWHSCEPSQGQMDLLLNGSILFSLWIERAIVNLPWLLSCTTGSCFVTRSCWPWPPGQEVSYSGNVCTHCMCPECLLGGGSGSQALPLVVLQPET